MQNLQHPWIFIETLNDEYDTESNDEIEERIAVQDHDSSLYYSTQDSQRKSPNTNQKNPPRNKIKTLDFGVQYSYSPGTECKKVQTHFSCSDQGIDLISSMALKTIDIRLSRTGSQPVQYNHE